MNTLTSAHSVFRAVESPKERKQRIRALVFGAIVLLQILIVFAIGIAMVQSSRYAEEQRAPAQLDPSDSRTGRVGSDPATAARLAAEEDGAILIGTMSRGSGRAKP